HVLISVSLFFPTRCSSDLVILAIFMQDMLGFTAFESGLALLPGAIVVGIMNPITGRIFDQYGAKWLTFIGLFILVITKFMFTNLTTETTFTYIAVVNALRLLSVSMIIMPVTTAGLNQLPSRLIPHGTAMNNTMRQVAGAMGTALLVTVMTTTVRPDEGIDGMIHGVNMSFLVAGITAVIAFVLPFFVKKPSSNER